MATDTELQYPFTSLPKPKPVYRLGAYKNKLLQIEIPCACEREAAACGKALEVQGYEIRIRAGATLPDSIEGESDE